MSDKTSRRTTRELQLLFKKNRRMLLLILALLLIAIGIFIYVFSRLSVQKFGALDESILIQIPAGELPEDTLYITQERRYYQRGNMTLIVPSIDIYTPIGESTSMDGLEEMPGLYEFAQLPGEGDVNVSIAGHRDIHGMEFYDLHLLEEGDFAYLLYDGMVYRYVYVDAKVVGPAEWDVIKPQGFSCMTLTTCDPIGTNRNRLVVRWELSDYEEFGEEYRFTSNAEAQP